MLTLRRILKYTPVVVLGLLVVAWVMSWFFNYGIVRTSGPDSFSVGAGAGLVVVSTFDNSRYTNFVTGTEVFFGPRFWDIGAGTVLGRFHEAFTNASRFGEESSVSLPFPWAICAVLPFAIGPLISFRFRLWHYLAYTALVALELAYYLRWQE